MKTRDEYEELAQEWADMRPVDPGTVAMAQVFATLALASAVEDLVFQREPE